jgi:hypothetical protein
VLSEGLLGVLYSDKAFNYSEVEWLRNPQELNSQKKDQSIIQSEEPIE